MNKQELLKLIDEHLVISATIEGEKLHGEEITKIEDLPLEDGVTLKDWINTQPELPSEDQVVDKLTHCGYSFHDKSLLVNIIEGGLCP